MSYDPLKPGTEQILAALRSAQTSSRIASYRDREPYGLTDVDSLPSRKIVVHSDGVGTKGALHWKNKTYGAAAQDAFAMNADDMPMARAIPFLYVTHVMMQEDNTQAAVEIVQASAELCASRNILMPAGGETAVMDTVQGLEIGGTMIGFVPDEDVKKQNLALTGDILIGIASSGVHSNGMTFIREAFTPREIDRYIDELTKPTRIYCDILKELMNEVDVHGMMHITGGGLAKIGRMLSPNTDAHVNNSHTLQPQNIFRHVHAEKRQSSRDMLKRFNCGIGYVVAVKESDLHRALGILFQSYPADEIGYVSACGSGKVHVKSPFDEATETY